VKNPEGMFDVETGGKEKAKQGLAGVKPWGWKVDPGPPGAGIAGSAPEWWACPGIWTYPGREEAPARRGWWEYRFFSGREPPSRTYRPGGCDVETTSRLLHVSLFSTKAYSAFP
jgi:hypothetical protein